MPKTGTSLSNSAASRPGAPGSYTLDGPPDRMIAAGSLASISATGIECGTISEYTFASRTRRAMSWAYCAPKSTTRTRSWSVKTGPSGGGTRMAGVYRRRDDAAHRGDFRGVVAETGRLVACSHATTPHYMRVTRPRRDSGPDRGATAERRPAWREIGPGRDSGPDRGGREVGP